MEVSTVHHRQPIAAPLPAGTCVASKPTGAGVKADLPVPLRCGHLAVLDGALIHGLIDARFGSPRVQPQEAGARRVGYTAFFTALMLAMVTIFLTTVLNTINAPQGGAHILSVIPSAVAIGLAIDSAGFLLDVRFFTYWPGRGVKALHGAPVTPQGVTEV